MAGCEPQPGQTRLAPRLDSSQSTWMTSTRPSSTPSDEIPIDLTSLLPRRTALDKDRNIADTKQKLWELSCELRRLLDGSGERQVLELFLGAYNLARRSTSTKDNDKQIEHDTISWVPNHLKSIAIKMIVEHNFTAHGELMA
jgi:hypothetical protein